MHNMPKPGPFHDRLHNENTMHEMPLTMTYNGPMRIQPAQSTNNTSATHRTAPRSGIGRRLIPEGRPLPIRALRYWEERREAARQYNQGPSTNTTGAAPENWKTEENRRVTSTAHIGNMNKGESSNNHKVYCYYYRKRWAL